MRVSILIFPGSNCDRDAYTAVRAMLGGGWGDVLRGEVRYVWHKETELPSRTDLVIVPGGFSYGDYLRSGAMAAQSPVMRAVKKYAAHGGMVLGICNGFQILTEAGLLPGTLLRNARLTFLCRVVHLRVEQNASEFTRGYAEGQVIRAPIAHHDGNYFADTETLARLEGERRILFRYCDTTGAVTQDANPNGSAGNIAGLVNEKGNVAGMMPHPERACDPLTGGIDGRFVFQSLAKRGCA